MPKFSPFCRPRALFSIFTSPQLLALTAFLTLSGCGRPDPRAAQQELTVTALSSDVSAIYSDVQALKSEQGLIFEQLASQSALCDETRSSSDQEQKRLRDLALKGTESLSQLQQLRQRLQEQSAQIDRLQSDILQLKKGVETVAHAMAGSDQSGFGQTYRVQPGDTLEKIARKTHCSIDDLRRINHLSNDLIVAGKNLQLPKADLNK